MKKDEIQNKDIDQLLKSALESADDLMVSHQLAEITFRKLRKKILLKGLFLELALKAGICFGSLAILAVAFVLTDGQAFMRKIFDFARINMPIVLVFLITSLAIIILDQIIIRYFNADQESATLL